MSVHINLNEAFCTFFPFTIKLKRLERCKLGGDVSSSVRATDSRLSSSSKTSEVLPRSPLLATNSFHQLDSLRILAAYQRNARALQIKTEIMWEQSTVITVCVCSCLCFQETNSILLLNTRSLLSGMGIWWKENCWNFVTFLDVISSAFYVSRFWQIFFSLRIKFPLFIYFLWKHSRLKTNSEVFAWKLRAKRQLCDVKYHLNVRNCRSWPQWEL